MPQLSMQSPVGALTVSEEGGRIVSLDWGWGRDQAPTDLLREAVRQINDYLDGGRRAFELPLAPAGTPYRQRVWATLRGIPYGQTTTYGALAGQAGGSARSIGQANRHNPIPLIIPCHRVVGGGGIGGYSGGEGLAVKRFLLSHEQQILAGAQMFAEARSAQPA